MREGVNQLWHRPENDIVHEKENISVQVTNPVYHDRGMFLKGYTTFSISTQPFNWDVNRRFKDFEWLHVCLKNRYCAHIVFVMLRRFLHFQLRHYTAMKTIPSNIGSGALKTSLTLYQNMIVSYIHQSCWLSSSFQIPNSRNTKQ